MERFCGVVGPMLFASSALIIRGVAMGKGRRHCHLAPPIAKKVAEAIFFGVHPDRPDEYRGRAPMDPPEIRTDYYNWMRDETRKDETVLKHIRAENAYCEEFLSPMAPLKEAIYKEMVGFMKETDDEVPYRHGDYLYYTRTVKGLAYKLHCRMLHGAAGEEAVILDENQLAEGNDYCDVGSCEPSPSHRLLAYPVDHVGYETYDIFVKDLSTGEIVDTIHSCSGDVEWGADDSALFYTKMDEEHRPFEVWLHVLGTPQDTDVLVFREEDKLFCAGVSKTGSDKFMVIESGSIETSEDRVIALEGVTGGDMHLRALANMRLVQARQEGLRYSCYHHGSYFYIVTNKDDAKNSKLMRVSTAASSLTNDHWEEVRQYDPAVEIKCLIPFRRGMAIVGREGGSQRMWMVLGDGHGASDVSIGANWNVIEFAESMYSIHASGNRVYDSEVIRLKYSSLVTPLQTLEINFLNGQRNVLREKEVPGYDRSLYRTARIFASSTHTPGCLIPISIVFHKSLLGSDDGATLPVNAPVLMNGYGSYGYSLDPSFDYTRLPLLNRGVVFAIAHIRGGGEMGRQLWYEEGGKYFSKMNTFHDFADCGRYLAESGLTARDKLAIVGRSAGGLLIGATVNMYPSLFKAAVADVPFVDVLNTMSDPTIPLTTGEWEEWGNPNERSYFDYMKRYCPYTNVAAQDYPSMLVTAGLHDPRVAYWEPAKWVAKLRELKANSNPLLFKTDLSSGHFSASDRYKDLKERSFEMSFVLAQITPPS